MPHISGPRYAELLACEKAQTDARVRAVITPFSIELSHALGTLAALTPWEQWPDAWRAAYQHCARSWPTAARLYRDQLPTDTETN